MNFKPEISFSTRIRKSPFFDSTIKWCVQGHTVNMSGITAKVKICNLPFLKKKINSKRKRFIKFCL